MSRLKIDKIEIRLKNIAPQAVRASLAGIDRELLEQLKDAPLPPSLRSVDRIGTLVSPVIRVSNPVSSSHLRRALSTGVVDALTSAAEKSSTRRD